VIGNGGDGIRRPKSPLLSERYRALAKECRETAQFNHSEQTRMRMMQLASDYERKAIQAETAEASLRAIEFEEAPLVSKLPAD
jgi:hypothetical protein